MCDPPGPQEGVGLAGSDEGRVGLAPRAPPLSYGENPEAPALSSAVSVKFDPTFGRHLVANRHVRTGDVLLVERPFAALPESEFRWSHCSHCLGRSRAPLPCPGCDWATFCSQQCLAEATLRYHRVECPAVRRYLAASGGPVTSGELHALRLAATCGPDELLACDEDSGEDERTRGFSAGRFDPREPRAVLSLCCHLVERPFEELLAACLVALHMLHSFRLSDVPDSHKVAGRLLRLFLIRESNSHALVELRRSARSATRLGCGLFPTSSLVNHSCWPNVVRTNFGATLVHFASRPLRRGEQLVMSYGVQFDRSPREERAAYLAKYFFTCRCLACRHDWPTARGLPSGENSGEPSGQPSLSEDVATVERLYASGHTLNLTFLEAERRVKNHLRMLACHLE